MIQLPIVGSCVMVHIPDHNSSASASAGEHLLRMEGGHQSEHTARQSLDSPRRDVSLKTFEELFGHVDLEVRPSQLAGAPSEIPLFSTRTCSLEPLQPTIQYPASDTEQLAQHAQQEALNLQLTDAQRRERNKLAQAASRQRKKVSVASAEQFSSQGRKLRDTDRLLPCS